MISGSDSQRDAEVKKEITLVDCFGIDGTIFPYSQSANLCAFDSNVKCDSSLVFIHGITEGFLSIPLLPDLTKVLSDMASASVIQLIMRSSYSGYGVTSLDTDVRDLVDLLKELKLRGKKRIILCGHSTGTQDVVHLLRWLQSNSETVDLPLVKGAIFLAPVSDREAFLLEIPETLLQERVKLAESKVKENLGEDLAPRDWGYEKIPCSYNRFISLSKRLGQEDMWSSDLSEDELSSVIGHVKIPSLIVYAEMDEYVPKYVDREVLLSRLQKAMPGCCTTVMVEKANHEFGSTNAQNIVVSSILKFTKQIFGLR